MKTTRKQIAAFLLVCVLIVGTVSPAASAEGTAGFAVGDLVEFGSYPQTKVTDEHLIALLNDTAQTWYSYGYSSGTGNSSDGLMCVSDYMRYCDVTHGGQKYRGVRFSQYRPFESGGTPESTEQDRNGYSVNTTYWFLWEALQWRVLDPQTGLVLCENVIDAQPFNNYKLLHGGTMWGNSEESFYFNNYEKSSIRRWLTDETDASSFLNTAFTAAQREAIPAVSLDNSCYVVYPTGGNEYKSGPTTDKIFLPSYWDLLNTAYGFAASANDTDAARRTVGTDYAECQGLYIAWFNDTKTCFWRLRTADSSSVRTCSVYYNGTVNTGDPYGRGSSTGYGIRPAMQLLPVTAEAHTHSYAPTVTAPTCLDSGYTTYRCAVCGLSYTANYTDPLGHGYGDWTVTQAATETAEGVETRCCTRCPATQTRSIPPTQPGWRFFSGGYGTEAAPFLISTAKDFDRIDDFYAAYGNDLPCTPVYFSQTADIVFWYNSETDNDGTEGYYPYNAWFEEEPNAMAHPTPVRQMHHAVYDGGGHTVELGLIFDTFEYSIVDDMYAGLFGHVTDSTVRNVVCQLGFGNRIFAADDSEGYVGFIACAENCLLSDITVTVQEYTQIYAEYSSASIGLLAGSASGCRIEHCFTNAGMEYPFFIGSMDSACTFSDTWAKGAYYWDDMQLPAVTGVIIGEGGGSCPIPQEYMFTGCEGYVLVDPDGVVQPVPLQYDPNATGYLFFACPSETVTVIAGAHGTVDGAGVYYPYSQFYTGTYQEQKTVTGLTPIPDTGCVFTGWEITVQNPMYSYDAERTMTLQPDGSYTYTSNGFSGAVTVTANFAPHEAHTFVDWVVTTEATCTADGEMESVCTECGYTETAPIPATGHAFSAWETTTAATPEAAGEETRTCAWCGATETRAIPVIPAGYGFFSGGYGTESAPFLISTVADFDHIDDFYAVYGDNLPCTPVYFTQTANLEIYQVLDYDSDGFDDAYAQDNYFLEHRIATPVSVMHDAVYDGGGYEIVIPSILDSDYAGVFGLVTDSTIRNVRVWMEGLVILSTAENGCAGMIARAENCLLDTIRVRLWGDARIESWTGSVNVGALVGCVDNCRVQNCLTQMSRSEISFIGGTTADFTSGNTWWVIDEHDAYHWQSCSRNVTGTVFLHESGACVCTLEISAQRIEIPDFMVLTDMQGSLQPEPLQYDPAATGLQYHLYYADRVTFAAGEHGSLTGAGSAALYGELDETKTVTGLIPIPDAGYVFAGWDIVSQNYLPPYAPLINRSMTQQADGSYTYATVLEYGIGTAAVTANFEPIAAGYGFFSGGYGTAESPFLISNAADLDRIDDFFAVYGDNLPSDPVYFTQTADVRFWYNSETDNDGTEGYYPYNPWDEEEPNAMARPIPVTEMHNAVYDGGGHCIILDYDYNGRYTNFYLIGDNAVGIFGLVTDSAIRNLNVDLGYGLTTLIGTGGTTSIGGAIGRAERCTLDHISVYLCMGGVRDGLLAGSASACHVTNCFTNASHSGLSFIGGADSTYTFSNIWAVADLDASTQDENGNTVSITPFLAKVTGVILGDGPSMEWTPAQNILAVYPLVDAQGALHLAPLQYDPDEAGQLYFTCGHETVTVEAGAHGAVRGAGVYYPYFSYFTDLPPETQTIPGLTPVPDTGYVFAGWDIAASYTWGTTRTMTPEADGSYTYASSDCWGTVTVTANFTPHETHTFGEWEVTTPATFDAAGSETRTCTVCGVSETRDLPILPRAVLSMTVPTEPVYTGDTFTVTLDLEQNPGLVGLSLALQYDPDALTLTNVQRGGMLLTGDVTCSKTLAVLPYSVMWEDSLAANHTETGTILTLTFTVQENASAGSTQILLLYEDDSAYDFDLNDVPLIFSGAAFDVVVHLPGDADGDGHTDLADAARILRFLAGGWDAQIDVRNTDVNGDGIVNLKDVTLIRRYIAGWNVTLC